MLEQQGAKLPKFRKTGTTIVGLIYKDGVILGADTRATEGEIVCDKNCEKIHYLAPNISCCSAGTAADTENITDMVSSQLALHRYATGRDSRVVTALTMLKSHLLGYQGRVSAALVLGGVDVTGPHLHAVYPHGSTDTLPFATMGSGSLAAMSVFESRYKENLTVGPGNHLGFTALVKSIVYQQLARKAATTIHGRVVALCGGPESVTPAVVAALTAEQFKAADISLRKSEYLRDLAEKFLSGDLSDEKLAAMSEDDLITARTAVKGIGVWSVQMFMIFHLHKPDVLPVGDLGIRRGFQKLYEMKEPSAAEMMDLSISWRPYRTLADWYLWRVN